MEEQKFWNWFIENTVLLENLIDDCIKDYKIYNELTEKLSEYDKYVIPEITGDVKGNYTLILSADGLTEGIEPVERLYATATPIKGWVIKKFRQPGFVNELNYNGVYVKEKDVKIRCKQNGDLIDVEILMKRYKENDLNYMALGTLYLDHFIGEYNVMTKIGRMTFSRLNWFTGRKGLISLRELLAIINGGEHHSRK